MRACIDRQQLQVIYDRRLSLMKYPSRRRIAYWTSFAEVNGRQYFRGRQEVSDVVLVLGREDA